MKPLFFILLQCLLTVGFSTATATSVSACGQPSETCCTQNEDEKPAGTACCSAETGCSENDGSGDCGGDCGKNGCPCLSPSVHAPAALADAQILLPQMLGTDTHAKPDWYFTMQIPKPVWLAVWLPPKIGC